jgi:PAS domain S-box-containing protein
VLFNEDIKRVLMNLPSASRTNLQKVLDAVPALVALYDIRSGDYLYVNKSVERVLGYSSSQFTEGGMGFVVSLVHPDDLSGVMKKNEIALALANAQTEISDEPVVEFEYRMLHKNGQWRWIVTEGTIFERDHNGNASLLLNVSIDITLRKKAELQLNRSLQALENNLVID